MELVKWKERRFDFGFSAGNYPAVLERLRGTPLRLDKLVSGHDHQTLTRRIGDEWSAQEHAGHLIDLEELHEKRFDEFAAGANVLSPADMSNQKTYSAQHNSHRIQDILKEFERVRSKLVLKAENADDEMVTRIAIHPRLNREMRLIDMLYFMAEHDDHHLAIIRRLLKA
jgi:hypothetical protein